MSTKDDSSSQELELLFLKKVIQIVLCTTQFLVVIFLVTLMTERVYRTPAVVIDFLDTMIDENAGLAVACEEYLATTDKAMILPDTPNSDMLQFQAVFYSYVDNISDYQIKYRSDSYIELVLLDENQQEIFPRVGFFYKLSANKKKIADYSICRLQPFSRYDKEFSELWY